MIKEWYRSEKDGILSIHFHVGEFVQRNRKPPEVFADLYKFWEDHAEELISHIPDADPELLYCTYEADPSGGDVMSISGSQYEIVLTA